MLRPAAPSSAAGARTHARAGGRAATRRSAPDRCGAASVRRAPRPPPARRPATSSAGTTRATGRPPALPRRACLRRVPRTSSISMAPSISCRCDSSTGAMPAAGRVQSVPVRRYRRRVCATKILVAKCEISRGRSTKFSLDPRRARSYCADAGSPLRRLRIRHPADSERAHERPVTRSPFGAARARAAEDRRGRPRGPAGVGRRWPRDGPRGDRSCEQRRLLGAFPRPGEHGRGERDGVAGDRYGRTRA